ncbi:MAG: metallophosphoesterase family protein [Treponema sp.]|nr:metallophosphoesterase family protein [Spirochaetia bacterium]MDD7458965.1 metallophosphoesterase family protein [Spirochaetales bacterium]MDY5812762.1 metallophosphoesterase family protein [Treponema sp.]MEE1182722.1 metallophosphoesterase family protein [Treponema sp.]
MKFLVLSDIHGNIENLKKLEGAAKEADGIIFAGDFTDIGKEDEGLQALKNLCKMNENIFAVRGNCDYPSLEEEFEASDISCERQLVMHEGLAFAGSHGGSKFTGKSPDERTEEELQSDFKIITDEGVQEWDNLIVVMHNPPKNTECDKIPGDIHVGSETSTKFIEEYKPLAVVTGHIHESAAICKIGNTTVINPGAVLEGKYAWLTVSKKDGKWNVDAAELKSL